MTDTESSVAIQDEEEEITASVIASSDDITVNGIVWLNPDGSTVSPAEDGADDEPDGK